LKVAAFVKFSRYFDCFYATILTESAPPGKTFLTSRILIPAGPPVGGYAFAAVISALVSVAVSAFF
jgi:hypothetical protein